MLKRNITYEDFDGNIVTEVFYFNLSKAELVELEVSTKEGLGQTLQRIIETKDNPGLIASFKQLILHSYGQRSDDGKRFIKNDQIREEFTQTPAYSALFMELATNDDAAATFIKGIIPADMSLELDKTIKDLATPSAETIIKNAQDSINSGGRLIPDSSILPPPPTSS